MIRDTNYFIRQCTSNLISQRAYWYWMKYTNNGHRLLGD